MTKRRYLVVMEPAGQKYSAYVPDLPGCVATDDTCEEAEANIREAVKLHLQGIERGRRPRPGRAIERGLR